MAYEQSATKRTMPTEAGFVAPKFALTGVKRNPPRKTQTINIPFGGGGGGGSNVRYAEEDYQRQLDLMDKIAEMSAGYSTAGTLGTTDVDYEGKMITQKLSPELQAQYDALLARSALSQEKVSDLDPIELQQYIYEQNLA